MSKTKVILLVSTGLLIVGAGLTGLFISRIQKPQITIEQSNVATVEEIKDLTESEPTSVTRKATFMDADAIHKGSGTATVVSMIDGPVLKFEEDFSVSSGPDLFVYLSPNISGDIGDFVSLGRLQSTSGAQVYSLPENHKDYKRVIIWCRAFSTQFASATF